MKFSKIALSIAAVIAVVTAAGSWYTGKNVENYYQKFVESSNKQLKELSTKDVFSSEIKDVKIERHFFSSDVTYRFVLELDGKQFVFNGEDKLYHGPLPLNRLAEFKFLPVLASWQSKIDLPEQLQGELQRSILGEGMADITYAGAVEGDFEIPALSYQGENGEKLDLSTVRMNYHYAQNLNDIKGELFAEQLQLTSIDGDKSELSGLNYRFTHTPHKDYSSLPIGHSEFTIKQLKGLGENNIELNDFELRFDGKVEGERALSDVLLSFKSLIVNGSDLGSLHLESDWNLDATLYQQFLDLSAAGDIDSEIVSDVMQKLLTKQPKFQIKELKLDNAGGKANLALVLNFNTFTPDNVKELGDVLKVLEQSSLDIALDKNYVTHFLQVRETAEEAKQLSKQFFAMLGIAGIGTAEENQAKLMLSINNGKVSLNGKELSEDKLQGLVLMLVMLDTL